MLTPAEYANDYEAFRRDIDPDCNLSEEDFYSADTHVIEELAAAIIEGLQG